LSNGRFQRVIDRPDLPGPREEVTRLCLCSGKIYYDIVGHEERESARDVAIARIELLYPFPMDELQQLFASYPSLARSSGSRRSRRTWAPAPSFEVPAGRDHPPRA